MNFPFLGAIGAYFQGRSRNFNLFDQHIVFDKNKNIKRSLQEDFLKEEMTSGYSVIIISVVHLEFRNILVGFLP